MFLVRKLFFVWFLIVPIFNTFSATELEEAGEYSRKRKTSCDEVTLSQPSPKSDKRSRSTGENTNKQSLKKGEGIYDKFQRILSTPPEPIDILPTINAAAEQAEGSRRFVQSFRSLHASKRGEEWHKKSSEDVNSFLKAATGGPHAPFPKEINVALARISFFSEQNQLIKKQELSYFFVSGWPANKDKMAFQKFSEKLSEGKLKGLDKKTDYGICLITMKYEKGQETTRRERSYHPFFKEINGIMKKEKEKNDERLLGESRINPHIKLTTPVEDHPIQGILYFHSEQSMRQSIKDAVAAQKKALPSPAYAIVDICSRYDMCWCCGDILTSCSHTDDFGLNVFFHVSGKHPYFDRPFDEQKKLSLREERKMFPGYTTGEAYKRAPHQPYVAHVAFEDLTSKLS